MKNFPVTRIGSHDLHGDSFAQRTASLNYPDLKPLLTLLGTLADLQAESQFSPENTESPVFIAGQDAGTVKEFARPTYIKCPGFQHKM